MQAGPDGFREHTRVAVGEQLDGLEQLAERVAPEAGLRSANAYAR
ncbi:hypothetical protein ACTWQF_17650 [Streptomyces sp. 8N114]